MRLPIIIALLSVILSGCRSTDPACLGRTAADYAPGRERYGAMSRAERRQAARDFDVLTQRCGWEP